MAWNLVRKLEGKCKNWYTFFWFAEWMLNIPVIFKILCRNANCTVYHFEQDRWCYMYFCPTALWKMWDIDLGQSVTPLFSAEISYAIWDLGMKIPLGVSMTNKEWPLVFLDEKVK